MKILYDHDERLHLRVRAVTINGHPHPYTTVAPENAFVDLELLKDSNERACLKCNPDIFDPSLECVYLSIKHDEQQKNCKM